MFLMRAAILLAIAANAFAQAWVPPAGEGSVSFSYQRIENTGHRLTDGTLIPAGQSLDMGVYVETEYSLTNHLSFAAGLPYVFTKYTDPNPPPPGIPYPPRDQCRCWHSGWQDFGVSTRYNIVWKSLALTPSIAVGVPSHDYEFRGETALGRDLRELRLALDVGGRLDRLSRNVSLQGRYSYAFVEQVLGIPNNRSNLTFEGDYVLKKRLVLRGLMGWQITHGGLRFGSMPPGDPVFPGDVDTPEKLFQHDRLLRDNNFKAGGGLAYSFEKFDLFASYLAYVSGTDSHAGNALTVGFSVPFHLRLPHR